MKTEVAGGIRHEHRRKLKNGRIIVVRQHVMRKKKKKLAHKIYTRLLRPTDERGLVHEPSVFQSPELEREVMAEAAYRRPVDRGVLPNFSNEALNRVRTGSSSTAVITPHRVELEPLPKRAPSKSPRKTKNFKYEGVLPRSGSSTDKMLEEREFLQRRNYQRASKEAHRQLKAMKKMESRASTSSSRSTQRRAEQPVWDEGDVADFVIQPHRANRKTWTPS